MNVKDYLDSANGNAAQGVGDRVWVHQPRNQPCDMGFHGCLDRWYFILKKLHHLRVNSTCGVFKVVLRHSSESFGIGSIFDHGCNQIGLMMASCRVGGGEQMQSGHDQSGLEVNSFSRKKKN